MHHVNLLIDFENKIFVHIYGMNAFSNLALLISTPWNR